MNIQAVTLPFMCQYCGHEKPQHQYAGIRRNKKICRNCEERRNAHEMKRKSANERPTIPDH